MSGGVAPKTPYRWRCAGDRSGYVLWEDHGVWPLLAVLTYVELVIGDVV